MRSQGNEPSPQTPHRIMAHSNVTDPSAAAAPNVVPPMLPINAPINGELPHGDFPMPDRKEYLMIGLIALIVVPLISAIDILIVNWFLTMFGVY